MDKQKLDDILERFELDPKARVKFHEKTTISLLMNMMISSNATFIPSSEIPDVDVLEMQERGYRPHFDGYIKPSKFTFADYHSPILMHSTKDNITVEFQGVSEEGIMLNFMTPYDKKGKHAATESTLDCELDKEMTHFGDTKGDFRFRIVEVQPEYAIIEYLGPVNQVKPQIPKTPAYEPATGKLFVETNYCGAFKELDSMRQSRVMQNSRPDVRRFKEMERLNPGATHRTIKIIVNKNGLPERYVVQDYRQDGGSDSVLNSGNKRLLAEKKYEHNR